MCPSQIVDYDVKPQNKETKSLNKTLRKLVHAINGDFFFIHKNKKNSWRKFNIVNIFAQNMDCGCALEPSQGGGSNEYPQSMFLIKIKKNRYTPVNPIFTI